MQPYWSDGTATIWHANALDLPLPDSSVDLIVTSPPYFGLRSYQDGCPTCAATGKASMRGYMERYCPECGKVGTVNKCPKCNRTTLRTEATKAAIRADAAPCPDCNGKGTGHYAGQLGSEPTPAEFVDALIAATREMVRVLKPSGSLWINLGDKYVADNRGSAPDWKRGAAKYAPTGPAGYPTGGMRQKSLMGIPWRYALRCIDDLGLILRAEVIWSKPNGLPESVTDRVRRSHEQWFHFTLEPRYYSAVDEVREEHNAAPRVSGKGQGQRLGSIVLAPQTLNDEQQQHPLGKLPGSVWTIPDDPASLVRSVLSAVSDGALTVDEGERIITWSTSTGSGHAPPAGTTAGNGRGYWTDTVTAGTTPSTSPPDERIASRTSSQSDPSGTDSPSTTPVTTRTSAQADRPAHTADASTPTTSTPSPSRPTSRDGSAPLSAPPDTRTTQRTHTYDETDGGESAADAWPTDPASTEHVNGPPSVWSVATQPLRVPDHLGVDHFAAYPMEFPRRIIRGWSPRDVCTACGEGRRPVSATATVNGFDGTRAADSLMRNDTARWAGRIGDGKTTITGYACACTPRTSHRGEGDWKAGRQVMPEHGSDDYHQPGNSVPRRPGGFGTKVPPSAGEWEYHFDDWTPAPTTPGVVLDPFGGTGTTALVAAAEGRTAHHVDLSADYCRLAQWRITDPGERARAREVEKPAVEMDGQDDLLGLLADG